MIEPTAARESNGIVYVVYGTLHYYRQGLRALENQSRRATERGVVLLGTNCSRLLAARQPALLRTDAGSVRDGR